MMQVAGELKIISKDLNVAVLVGPLWLCAVLYENAVLLVPGFIMPIMSMMTCDELIR